MPVRLLPVAIATVLLAAPLASRAQSACGLLGSKAIASVTNDPSVSAGMSGPSSCIWHGKQATVYLSIHDAGTWSTAKSAYQNYGMESVSGVGTDAFFESAADPKPSFYVLKNAHFIILRVNVAGFSKDQTKAALQALGGQAADRL